MIYGRNTFLNQPVWTINNISLFLKIAHCLTLVLYYDMCVGKCHVDQCTSSAFWAFHKLQKAGKCIILSPDTCCKLLNMGTLFYLTVVINSYTYKNTKIFLLY